MEEPYEYKLSQILFLITNLIKYVFKYANYALHLIISDHLDFWKEIIMLLLVLVILVSIVVTAITTMYHYK